MLQRHRLSSVGAGWWWFVLANNYPFCHCFDTTFYVYITLVCRFVWDNRTLQRRSYIPGRIVRKILKSTTQVCLKILPGRPTRKGRSFRVGSTLPGRLKSFPEGSTADTLMWRLSSIYAPLLRPMAQEWRCELQYLLSPTNVRLLRSLSKD